MTPRRTLPNRGSERLGAAARTPLTAADYPDHIVREALAVGKVSAGARHIELDESRQLRNSQSRCTQDLVNEI